MLLYRVAGFCMRSIVLSLLITGILSGCVPNGESKKEVETTQEEGIDLPETSTQLPEELLIKQEESKKIQEAMRLLDSKHRAIIALRYFDNLSYNEIAQILEIPLGTVKSRINTAINALRRELVEKEVAP